jgi:hypothetical protein
MMLAGSTILKDDEEIKQGGRQKEETPQGKTQKRKEKSQRISKSLIFQGHTQSRTGMHSKPKVNSTVQQHRP